MTGARCFRALSVVRELVISDQLSLFPDDGLLGSSLGAGLLGAAAGPAGDEVEHLLLDPPDGPAADADGFREGDSAISA